MYDPKSLEQRARDLLERNRRYEPISCCHNPRTTGEPNPSCEGCRIYPISRSLPDPRNPLRKVPAEFVIPE